MEFKLETKIKVVVGKKDPTKKYYFYEICAVSDNGKRYQLAFAPFEEKAVGTLELTNLVSESNES